MIHDHVTLTQFLIDQRSAQTHQTTGDLNSLILAVSTACKVISKRLALGQLRTYPGGSVVPAQEEAFDILSDAVARTGLTCGMLSDTVDTPFAQQGARQGHYVLTCDPLDGARNVDLNGTTGTIFSILRSTEGTQACMEDFLQPGVAQVAAGYAIYGATTMLVLTLGDKTHGFTLDPLTGEWYLTHPKLTIPEQSTDFHINSSYARFWEPPVKRYVDECLQGTAGPRGKDFNMRWVASIVADCHRVLMRGGVFLSPRLVRDDLRHGKLLLLQQANPIAFLVNQAGGLVTAGRFSPLATTPVNSRQHSPLIFGSAREISRIEDYHTDENSHRMYTSPLFGERGLFASRDE